MTPCKEDRTPDFEALVKKALELVDAGMSGVIYCGSMGDWPLLTDEQRMEGVARLCEAGVPVVVVIVSGRPLIIENEIDKWDGLIAAWLPGSEGKGVTDVLFGDYNPTGRLSVSWPRNMEQIPINFGDKEYDPLFEYGFGLSY